MRFVFLISFLAFEISHAATPDFRKCNLQTLLLPYSVTDGGQLEVSEKDPRVVGFDLKDEAEKFVSYKAKGAVWRKDGSQEVAEMKYTRKIRYENGRPVESSETAESTDPDSHVTPTTSREYYQWEKDSCLIKQKTYQIQIDPKEKKDDFVAFDRKLCNELLDVAKKNGMSDEEERKCWEYKNKLSTAYNEYVKKLGGEGKMLSQYILGRDGNFYPTALDTPFSNAEGYMLNTCIPQMAFEERRPLTLQQIKATSGAHDKEKKKAKKTR